MSNTENTLRRLLAQKILLFDGAMGTMIQRLKFDEQDFRGKKYANHNRPLKGCNDLLGVTQPEAIAQIHAAYL
jgi:5-methyltetrahydrofolate--homocysteine methyltransferase